MPQLTVGRLNLSDKMPEEKQLKELKKYVFNLESELEYILSTLDTDNMGPNTTLRNIEQLKAIVEDSAKAIQRLEKRVNALS